MPAPRELSQQIPASRQKLGCKAPGWGQSFGVNPRGARGEMAMDAIDTCITL